MDTCIYKMKTGKHALVVTREYILHALVPLKMNDFLIKELQREAGKTAQTVKHTLCRREDLSSGSQHPHKTPGRVAPTYYLSPSEAEAGNTLAACWPDSLADAVSSRFTERACLKKKGREGLRKACDVGL